MPPYVDDNIMYSNNTDNNDERMMMSQPLIQTNSAVDTTTTGLSKSIKNKKCVSFSEGVLLKKIPHLNDMKKVLDINTIWYTSEEFHGLRYECKTIIDQMNRTIQEKQATTICTRGLEKYKTFERENSQRRKFNVIQAVLDEQDFQRSLGMNEPELLAVASQWYSNESQIVAHNVAIRDYKKVSS